MSIIIVLELGLKAYWLDVVATFSTCKHFCVVDSKAGNEPNVANPPFLKRKKQNLKFVRFFGGVMDPTNCNRKINNKQQLQQ
jgi:hypothetical protein